MIAGGTYSSAPINTVAPVVSGTATRGQTLSTTNGTWTGAPTPTFTYQWQRAGSNIGSATSSTYTLVTADVGNAIRCVVTATNVVAAVSANSNATAAVAGVVPGAPTIGTATVSGTTASVPFTAPADNGGLTITTYTATSSPGSITGTLSQAGSGTVTVTGLTAGTAYTFTVTATNSAGTGSASAASNSVTPPVVGQQAFTTAGTYTWVAPASVTKVSVLTVGSGAQSAGNRACLGMSGGGGGGLAYGNNLSVTPGCSYAIRVPGLCDSSNKFASFNSTTVRATSGGLIDNSSGRAGGTFVYGTSGASGGTGGTGGACCPYGGGGGGAAGYSGTGGNGGGGSGSQGGIPGTSGSGGGGGGGANYGGGGGVGLLGEGSSGAGGSSSTGRGGKAGSGGTDGSNSQTGGVYGGGGGGNGASGGGGAVRIIWPGCSRTFPSTGTADQ